MSCLMLVSLTACMSSEATRQANMQADAQHCASLGFAPGSMALAHCMDTAASSRAADDYLAQRRFQQLQDQNRQQMEDMDARNRAQDAAAQSRFERAMSNGPGGSSDSSAGSMPSGAAIPGMECTGTGSDATCNAR
jgi:hypothetical protein